MPTSNVFSGFVFFCSCLSCTIGLIVGACASRGAESTEPEVIVLEGIVLPEIVITAHDPNEVAVRE